MTITVNAEPRDIPDDTTVQALVALLGLAQRTVAVEVNRELVPRREHAAKALRPGDAVEIVSLVGGG